MGHYFLDTQYTRFGHSEFSAEEQAAINRALQQKLGPNFISQRPAGTYPLSTTHGQGEVIIE